MLECKHLAKDIAGDKRTLGYLKGLYTEDFWTWYNSDGLDYDRDAYLVLDKCVNFENKI